MAGKYYIYTDASADVDLSRFAADDIKFVPMRIMVGDEERICETIESEAVLKQFYQAQKDGKATRTSQITPNTYIETFEPALKEGISIIYLSLSSGLTKTFDSVCLAASELEETYQDAKVYPVDTFGATGGMGLLLELAVANRKNGMSVEENTKNLKDLAQNTVLWFMVDDLMYLKRGGRISASSAVIGSALNIKPILEVDPEGKLITVEKKRGPKMGLKALVEKYRTYRDDSFGNRVYIVHGDAQDKADELETLILKENPQADITKMCLCPVIGAHTGPGMVAAIFGGKRV